MPPLAYFGIESTGVTIAIDLLIVFGVLLYLALVYWTYVDARRRIVDPTLVGCAAGVALFPFVGTLLYLVVRPPETLEDARERELDVETTRLRLHQLESALCPHCDYPVESEYVRCPSCLRKLKDRCKNCSRPLDRAWTICPFCETEVPARPSSSRRPGAKRGSRSRPALERELASERAPAGSDRRESKPSSQPAAARRGRAAASAEDAETTAGGRRSRAASATADGRDAEPLHPERKSSEPAAASTPRTSERSRPAGTPRPGSAY